MKKEFKNTTSVYMTYYVISGIILAFDVFNLGITIYGGQKLTKQTIVMSVVLFAIALLSLMLGVFIHKGKKEHPEYYKD